MTARLLIRITLLLVAAQSFAPSTSAQQPTQGEDVVRVNTELVQTDFAVVDRDGNFVKDLKKDQFVLKVDGKPREITFFDQIAAGSRNEEAQLAAARGAANSGKGPAVPLDRGRVVMFFIDDVHLSVSSLIQVRTLLKRFIEREMRQNDFCSIATTTGRAGFLEQLTDNKAVLLAALQRIGATSQATLQTMETPPMSEYQALQIQRRDQDLLNYYVEALLRDFPQLPRDSAESMVASRANGILQNSSFFVTRTMSSLKGLVDTTKTIPGRKLLFFISDGFFLDYDRSDNLDRLQRVTAAAARAGTVVYSMDARGLSAGLPDASQAVAFDVTGRVARSNLGELTASRDGMSSLASDTGGKTIFNTNALTTAVTNAIKETSVYYLIAWRPENDEQRNPKFRRIEVSVRERPQLAVRFRRGVGETIANAEPKRAKGGAQPAPTPATKTPGEEMRSALRLSLPTNAMPVAVSLNFVDIAEKGSALTTSVAVTTSSLQLEPEAATATGLLDVAGYVLDDQGKSVSNFSQRLTIHVNPKGQKPVPPDRVFYNDAAFVKPGLYQVRVAARDAKSGVIGTAYQWIEIPDLKSKGLAMSTLIVGESKSNEQQEVATGPGVSENPELRQVNRNVDHRFPRSSYLRFLTFIYNATRSSAAPSTPPAPATEAGTNVAANEPDLAVQIQVFRDDQPVVTTPLHKIPTTGLPDLQRIPYAADIRLDTLQPGAYMLHVTVIDRLAKSSFSQRLNFEIE